MMIVTEKKTIATQIRAFRELLNLRPKALVERAVAHGIKLTYQDLYKIENGQNALSNRSKRIALASAFQVPFAVIDDLVALRVTPEDAVKLVTPIAMPSILSGVSSGADPDWPEREAERLGTLTKLAHLKQARFPNLELCLMYHNANAKLWPLEAVVVARSGALVPHDLPTPEHWMRVLDRLESAARVAEPRKAPEGTPPMDGQGG